MTDIDIRRSALVDCPASVLFDIIDRPEDYPQFLPWCAGSTLLERSESHTAAQIRIDYKGLRLQFTTRNPKSRPTQMRIELVDGPFSRFDGQWQLTPLSADACRVDFALTYAFRHGIVTSLSGKVFAHIADTLVDAFVARAQSTATASGSSS